MQLCIDTTQRYRHTWGVPKTEKRWGSAPLRCRSKITSSLHGLTFCRCTFVQGGNSNSDLLPADPRPGVENEGLRLQVSTGQEPGVRDRDGVRRTPRTVHRHRRLLRCRLLRDTSSRQDSASRFDSWSSFWLPRNGGPLNGPKITPSFHFAFDTGCTRSHMTRPQDMNFRSSLVLLYLFGLIFGTPWPLEATLKHDLLSFAFIPKAVHHGHRTRPQDLQSRRSLGLYLAFEVRENKNSTTGGAPYGVWSFVVYL